MTINQNETSPHDQTVAIGAQKESKNSMEALIKEGSKNGPELVPKATVSKVQTKSDAREAAGHADIDPNSIIIGYLDASGRSHAALFAGGLVDAATASAKEMNVSPINITTPALHKIAKQLPIGKVYESGKAFIPFVKASLFEELAKQVPVVAQKDRSYSLPRHMTAEHKNILVNAKEERDRSKLTIGSSCLAYEEHDEAFHEVVIVEADGELKDDTVVTVRWRYYDDEPAFEVMLGTLALLPPVLPYDPE